jgi:hypothetical protein
MEIVFGTEFPWQPNKDVAIITATVNAPHFLNRAILKIVLNIRFILASLIFLKSPFNYLYEIAGKTLHLFWGKNTIIEINYLMGSQSALLFNQIQPISLPWLSCSPE